MGSPCVSNMVLTPPSVGRLVAAIGNNDTESVRIRCHLDNTTQVLDGS